ncbi:multimodular transpeptidase-transglycosylase [Gracilibacillus boraciitolerans JCM 21714]|uniref:Multimodular transpeptidase-transglycosylase n=1 Tax=Gracilibacillus boraciitolerans JCM 21714 TaxID=1298598 RepID=W4VGM8_9BACI|nr:transglycosylase domain-containing protein [Gracilibacillus boraciitolerans]GAE92550.1 multimodular transpeptidase-transglycosylase [Gracilibacillus boraciitolerans JCM 21714]
MGRRSRRKKRRLWKAFIFLFLLVGSFSAVLLIASFLLGPPSLDRPQNTIYYSEDQKVIGEEFGSEKRYWMPLDMIDDRVEKATIWTEDQYFYNHFGFDFKRLASAIWKDIKTMSLKEGASTITQQYARNLYLTHEKTWKRKLYEAFYTIRLEMFYDKDQLLEGYLNTIYYGHGAYGIEAASKYFFAKSASELSWAEAAMLAGIPKGPSLYSPFHNLENAKTRQEFILNNLYDMQVIDAQTYETAINEPLQFSDERTIITKGIAPYYQDVVVEELKDILEIDIEEIRSGGYQVYTTLNTMQQQALQTATDTIVDNPDIQIGAMAMEPETGAIKALVGGRNYEDSPFNRVTQAKRMPGSAFKPFLYYAALENGMTAATTLMSKPTTFELADGNIYQPGNYNDYYANQPITMAQAIASSDNIFAVKTNMYVTPERFVRVAKEKFKIESELEPVASLALGTEVVSVKEMVTGYSILANGGQELEGHTITKVTDAHGEVLFDRDELKAKTDGWSLFSKEDDGQILNEKYAFIISELMKGMFREELNGYMSVTGASIANKLSNDYAGKSGTTNVDNWMIGFSPSLTAGVWVGYDDNREIVKTSDHQYAKEVWASFMEKAHENITVERQVPPEHVVEVEIDLNTGFLAADTCSHTAKLFFVKGTEPEKYCTLHIEDDQHEHPEEFDEIIGG